MARHRLTSGAVPPRGGHVPLPVPQGGGSIEELASFLNLPSRNEFVLVVAWLLATLRAGGPYPALAISGEQARLRRSFRSCSRIWSIPTRRRCGRLCARNAIW